MFVDKAEIIIQSGKGGDGAVSFRREPFVPNGGPDGGNGGKGGDVVFLADHSLHTLMDLKFRRKYKADPGQNGMGANKYGKSAEDLVIRVPVGCVLIDEASGAFMADLSQDGDRFVAAVGGKGGLGNSNFKNSVRQAPNFAEAGSEGQKRTVALELKLIADVGLIGLPNVGKSTLLAGSTGAKPKIANYHFTTIAPNLGVVELGYSTFVLADIPGLIEGAAEGAGLGHDFLKHIERTKVLIHVLDAAGSEGRDPLEDYHTVRREMAAYSPLLLEKPEIAALNKMDVCDRESEAFRVLLAELDSEGVRYYEISAMTKEGVPALMKAAQALLSEAEEAAAAAAVPGVSDQSRWMRVARIEDDPDYRDIQIEAAEDGAYELSGKQLHKIFRSTNFNDPGSLGYLNEYLKTSGAIRKLKARGLRDGDTIRIEDFDLEWYDDAK
ncbi:MAG: GTPase ObgE [Clostridiales bacterium]|nr:GTPase ObgE [Clostridiales bacterium]